MQLQISRLGAGLGRAHTLTAQPPVKPHTQAKPPRPRSLRFHARAVSRGQPGRPRGWKEGHDRPQNRLPSPTRTWCAPRLFRRSGKSLPLAKGLGPRRARCGAPVRELGGLVPGDRRGTEAQEGTHLLLPGLSPRASSFPTRHPPRSPCCTKTQEGPKLRAGASIRARRGATPARLVRFPAPVSGATNHGCPPFPLSLGARARRLTCLVCSACRAPPGALKKREQWVFLPSWWCLRARRQDACAKWHRQHPLT